MAELDAPPSVEEEATTLTVKGGSRTLTFNRVDNLEKRMKSAQTPIVQVIVLAIEGWSQFVMWQAIVAIVRAIFHV